MQTHTKRSVFLIQLEIMDFQPNYLFNLVIIMQMLCGKFCKSLIWLWKLCVKHWKFSRPFSQLIFPLFFLCLFLWMRFLLSKVLPLPNTLTDWFYLLYYCLLPIRISCCVLTFECLLGKLNQYEFCRWWFYLFEFISLCSFVLNIYTLLEN